MGSDRVTPTEPRKPFRPRLNTERGVAPPGTVNRQPPRPIPREEPFGDATLDEGQAPPKPWPKKERGHSPPPEELPPASNAEYATRIAELAEDAEEANARAEAERDARKRAEAELARERRKSRPEPESEPPATSKAPSRSDWSKLIFQLLTLVSLGGAGYAAARPPPAAAPSKDVEVYAALRDAVTRLDQGQAKQAADLAELRSWLRGYLEATGVKVVDPPGAPPPQPVELAPAPLPSPNRLRRAPDVQVRTPLPVPRPVPEPVRLPADIKALPRAP